MAKRTGRRPATHGHRIGFHVSIENGLHKAVGRAAERGCTAFQVFCGNPRGWRLQERTDEEIDRFRQARDEAELYPLYVHACYLINPCASDSDVFVQSVARLSAELELAARMGAEYYVLHPGSHKGLPAEWGVERAIEAVSEALDRAVASPTLLLEDMASPHGPGGEIDTLAAVLHGVLDRVPGAALGLAIDSCHAFSAGYDLRREAEVERLVQDIDSAAGRDRVQLLHVNDSRDEPGSRRDRHTHIGKGTIGRKGLANLLNQPALSAVPKILETPWESVKVDRRNLRAVVSLLAREG
jgi:deoxyribonuclease-4